MMTAFLPLRDARCARPQDEESLLPAEGPRSLARHCERSEAIQSHITALDCFTPRNDGDYGSIGSVSPAA
jgi:hypothetical protein